MLHTYTILPTEIMPGRFSKEGEKLVLLSASKKPVGLGTVCNNQEKIHGHDIPHGHIKVSVDYIKPQTRPPIPMEFDDEVLQCGQFCVWPSCYTSSAVCN